MGASSEAATPGVRQKPQSFLPRFHWELLVCGCAGHQLEGMDAAHIRPEDEILVIERDGQRWYRCLRCDSYLPLDPPENPTRDFIPARHEIILPLRGKPLRDKIVLRAIAVNRALHFMVLALLGVAILVFSAKRADLHASVVKVVADLGGGTTASNIDSHHGLAYRVEELFSLNSHRLHIFALIAMVYAAIEGLEAIGLWYTKRWAEYLTFIVTASLLPLEIYELSHHISPFKVVAFVINIAVVAYLMFAKRLFGIRGGAAADEELKARDVGWQALERTAPVYVP
jgi:uncharacterized membrane protein (DUF2068 family)